MLYQHSSSGIFHNILQLAESEGKAWVQEVWFSHFLAELGNLNAILLLLCLGTSFSSFYYCHQVFDKDSLEKEFKLAKIYWEQSRHIYRRTNQNQPIAKYHAWIQLRHNESLNHLGISVVWDHAWRTLLCK